MKVKTVFSDVKQIINSGHKDKRGHFTEIYNKELFKEKGIKDNFIQDNFSFSRDKFTIRGMHFQNKPKAQSKLIRVVNGLIEDFFIDLRQRSKTYLKSSSITLSPNNGWLYIPRGFAHGFCTLENNTSILYKVDNYYSPNDDMGINWNDDYFNLNWPLKNNKPILSSKDKNLPKWIDISNKVNF
tara:strand:+ start:345 stop:896 length:552 start_codon:yes stop_codon:yes gene_type:complete